MVRQLPSVFKAASIGIGELHGATQVRSGVGAVFYGVGFRSKPITPAI